MEPPLSCASPSLHEFISSRPNPGGRYLQRAFCVGSLLLLHRPLPCLCLCLMVKLIAHRGSSTWAIPNTLTAITKALEQSADAIAIDVGITSDGHAVLVCDTEVSASLGRSLAVVSPFPHHKQHQHSRGCRLSTSGG